jgi:enoyl-CoA hydratase/carnithine racemase
MVNSNSLQVLQQGAVRVLTLNRPEAMNALSSELAGSLLEAVKDAEADGATRAVVIAGAGHKAFSAGADLKERRQMDAAQKWAQSRTLWSVNEAIWQSPKAFVAAVHGWCLGGGFELALYCDARVASDDARFGFPEMALGAFPGAGGAVALPRLIGRAAAAPFFYRGHRATAAEALKLCIVEQVIPPGQTLAAAVALAQSIADSTSPLGFAAVKRVLNEGPTLPFGEAVALDQSQRRPLEATEDYAEGMAAQAGKRNPVFRGL